MDRRRFLTAVGATSGGIALSGCADDDGGPTDDTDTQDDTGADDDGMEDGGLQMPDPYRVGANGPSAPTWEFPAFPLFSDSLQDNHGSETERTAFLGFSNVVSGVLSEEAEICYLSLQAVINARAQGLPIVAFLDNANEYTFPIVVSDAIDDWDDLEGEAIAVQDTSGVSYASTRAMVNEELGDPEAVEYQSMAGTENRLAALESGEMDAAAVFTSGAFAAEAEGYGRPLAFPADYEITRNQSVLVWATLEPNVESEAEMLQETVDTLLDAQEEVYERDVSSLVSDAMATDLYADFDEDVWERSLESARESELWSRDGEMTQEQVDRGQDLLQNAGLIAEDERVDVEDIFVDDFL